MTPTPGPQLAADIDTALAVAVALPAGYRAGRLVLAVDLRPEVRATAPARQVLRARGATILGSSGSPETGACVYAAATTDTWQSAAVWFATHAPQRDITGFRCATARLDLRRGDHTVPGAWSATLHPASEPTGAEDEQVAAFTAAVTDLGGIVHTTRVHTGSLTYLAVTLPDDDAARTLARFNSLRHLAPAARIGFR